MVEKNKRSSATGFYWPNTPWRRWAKTLFFLLAMTASLLICCAPPLLVALLDLLLPSALLSAASDPPLSLPAFAAQLAAFTFRSSLVDVPLLCIARSVLILCAYAVCDGRGPYLGITTVCSVASVGYVSLKAAYLFGVGSMQGSGFVGNGNRAVLVEALLLSSLVLGMAHILAAYRTSCRERRKLLVYQIDIEAVSPYKSGIPNYQKIALSR